MALSEELRVPLELESRFVYDSTDAALVDDAPAVRAADEILESAIGARASDVHIEPSHGGGRVRQRIDGVLYEMRHLPEPLFSRVVSRIKLLACMDIADRRLPQDGRYVIERSAGSMDARISSMPTIDGERLAIRLLHSQMQIPGLDALGMPRAMLARYRALIGARAGFIVVCGPTGSGKTTTLYASLAERNVAGQNLCTVEDPVEARMPGIAQVQVNVRAGMTFAAALRAFLRQDPDVVMIGEMRDAETASVAISAALSGQMVFTTLHSSSASRAVERLLELGSTARSIAAAISAIVSQRLVRRLCAICKRRSVSGSYESSGCDACAQTGYRGRIAIFEMATVPDGSLDCDYEPLTEVAKRLVREGETSFEEVRRVLDAGAL